MNRFDKQREISLKCDAKNSTYICISLSLYIYIYHTLDNRYGFAILIGNSKNHVATLTCLEWHTENMLTFHHRLVTDNLGDYLYLKNGSLKFEVDPHQFNMRLHHFSQYVFNLKKKRKEKSSQDCDWLGKWLIDVGIYGSKVAEGFSTFQRRSCPH